MDELFKEYFEQFDISISGYRMDNGEHRYRLTSGKSAYIRTESKGAVWQKSHFHSEQTEYFLVEEGKVLFATNQGGKVVVKEYWKGDFFKVLPMVPHNMCLSDGGITHTVKFGGKPDWIAYPELEKIAKVEKLMGQNKIVFLLGSKGIPANYGGFETFIEKLTLNQIDKSIQYYVSCQCDSKNYTPGMHDHNGAKCFHVKVPDIGHAKAVYYDWMSLKWAIHYIEKYKIQNAVIFICACRIGPMIAANIHKIHKLGAKLVVNPDGHEWMRAKWNAAIKAYWHFSEKLCVKHADFLICDSMNIEKYIKKDFAQYSPKTTFIAYGSETSKSLLKNDDPKIVDWYKKWNLRPGQYYVNIARLVPENNYETIVREFMASKTDKSLVVAASLKGNKFYEKLKEQFHFENDSRIKFVDGIYDQELLKKIRENAYGYIHGHSVGGTNPSLLEALGTLDLNLLYDCGFNSEVGEDGALYWSIEEGSLRKLIEKTDAMSGTEIRELGDKVHKRIAECYTWEFICDRYEEEFRRGIQGEY